MNFVPRIVPRFVLYAKVRYIVKIFTLDHILQFIIVIVVHIGTVYLNTRTQERSPVYETARLHQRTSSRTSDAIFICVTRAGYLSLLGDAAIELMENSTVTAGHGQKMTASITRRH